MALPKFESKPRQPFSLKELYGQFRHWFYNSSGDPVKVLADSAGIPRTRPFEPYEHQTIDDMPATNTTFYTVPASTLAKLWVEVHNTGSSENTVRVALVESGGSEAANRRILNDFPLPANAIPVKLGPYHLHAAGTVQGLCETADEVNIVLTIEEYGTGDAVTL